MFSRKSNDNKISDEQNYNTTIEPNSALENSDLKTFSLPEENHPENNPEIVNVIEKISSIVSPYFIAIVGLYLYDRNIIIGFLLITLGMISLLKITFQDLEQLLIKIKNFFSLKE